MHHGRYEAGASDQVLTITLANKLPCQVGGPTSHSRDGWIESTLTYGRLVVRETLEACPSSLSSRLPLRAHGPATRSGRVNRFDMANVKWRLAVVSAILATVVQAGLDIPPAFKEPPSDEVDAVNP